MTERIKILEMIKDFGVEGGGGGASRFCEELSLNIDPSRFEVSVCGLWDSGTPFEREHMSHLIERGIPAFTAARWNDSIPYIGFVRAYRTLRAMLTAHPVSIVHSHSEFADVAALMLKTLPNRPSILRTVHNGFRLEWRKRPLRRWLLSYLFYPLYFDLEIGVSQSIVENLNRRSMERMMGRKAQMVYNGIDLQRFFPTNQEADEKRKVLGIPHGAQVIGSIGRLAEEKGYTFLLEAFAHALKLRPEAYLLLVGDGPLNSMLRKYAAALGISSHVVFAGSQKNIEVIFNSLDLFVSSSLWEGASSVILESMASGTPIVATNIAGTREIIRDKQNGWLVPPGDATALGQTILVALEDATSRQTFANNARRDVQSFSIKLIAAEHEKIYSAVIHSKRL